jgi:hypothetical protein
MENENKPKGKRSQPKGVPVKSKPAPPGRPSIFTQEIADEICKRIATGESLIQICKDEHMPCRDTVHAWLLEEDKKAFSDQYTRARDAQAEYLFDEILELSDEAPDQIVGDDKSDNARVQAKRLQVDSRKWYLSKVLPKKYGEKVDVTSGGKPITSNQITFVRFNESESK